MRHFLTAALLFSGACLHAQVVDRYPYIQQTAETSTLIAWNTATAGTGTVAWGTSPSQLTNTLTDAGPVQKHALTLTGLQPNTQYYYQVTTDAGYTSAVESFFTAKTLAERNLSFLHYGDCGYNNTVQNQIGALMEQEDVDFAIVTGDVDQGVGDNYDNVFFGVYRDMLARDCHYTAIGNHDTYANGGTDFFDCFYQFTNNPQQSEHYYSFTWGNAKFICFDSNIDYNPGSDQHNFILNEIACNEQQWVFLFCHHPPWTNAWSPDYYLPLTDYYLYDGNDDMRTSLMPYLEQFDVDFMLNGHSHCYQRGSYNGVEYVISGGAGASSIDSRKCNTFPNYGPCAPNIQQELYINQYVKFTIQGDTATYVCIDINGNVVDSVTKIKPWAPYAAQVTTQDESTAGAADGAASVSATGPRPPYSYTWSNGGAGASISNLSPGTYYVTITDVTGCTHLDSAVVAAGPVANAEPVQSALRIFPNPALTRCELQFPNAAHAPFTLRLYDLQGRELRHIEGITSESITLDRGNLAAGSYQVVLSQGAVQYTARLELR